MEYSIKGDKVVYDGVIKSNDMEDFYKVKFDPWNLSSESEKRKTILSEVFKDITDVTSILDIGCSLGYTFINLKELLGSSFEYYGIDISFEAISQMQTVLKDEVKSSKCVYRVHNIEKEHIHRKFDMVLLMDVIYYFNPTTWKETLDRILEQNVGKYVLVVDCLVRFNYRDYYKYSGKMNLIKSWQVPVMYDGKNKNIKCRLYQI